MRILRFLKILMHFLHGDIGAAGDIANIVNIARSFFKKKLTLILENAYTFLKIVDTEYGL